MSFQQGLSGLKSASKALDVISNNVANSSTVGFKSSSAHFADLYAASLSNSGTNSAGIGTLITAVAQQFTQGDITSTNNTLDLAINGSGFYKVTTDAGTVAYTRNGQFSTDVDGYIVNDKGDSLMGYIAAADGTIVASDPKKIQIDTSVMAPQATGTTKGATMKLNLNSSSTDVTVGTIDPTNSKSYTYSTSMTVYDSLGVDHTVTLYFAKDISGSGGWNVSATLDGDYSATDGDPSTLESLGTLTFDTSGNLTSAMPITLPTATSWDSTNGSANLSAVGNWTVDFSETTSYSADSTLNSKTQDGYASGSLSSYTVDDQGVISGKYSNGQTKVMAQVCLTLFANNNGLDSLGNNLWAETAASGQGLDGTPGSGARGVLQSSSVEDSNVNLTTELVNMITMQRNYQANSQSIKTQDEMMQTIVNLK